MNTALKRFVSKILFHENVNKQLKHVFFLMKDVNDAFVRQLIKLQKISVNLSHSVTLTNAESTANADFVDQNYIVNPETK